VLFDAYNQVEHEGWTTRRSFLANFARRGRYSVMMRGLLKDRGLALTAPILIPPTWILRRQLGRPRRSFVDPAPQGRSAAGGARRRPRQRYPLLLAGTRRA
jgi:hypothetical protein